MELNGSQWSSSLAPLWCAFEDANLQRAEGDRSLEKGRRTPNENICPRQLETGLRLFVICTAVCLICSGGYSPRPKWGCDNKGGQNVRGLNARIKVWRTQGFFYIFFNISVATDGNTMELLVILFLFVGHVFSLKRVMISIRIVEDHQSKCVIQMRSYFNNWVSDNKGLIFLRNSWNLKPVLIHSLSFHT